MAQLTFSLKNLSAITHMLKCNCGIKYRFRMLNRIINDVQGEEEEKYINLMKETANNTDLPDDVRDEAQFYLD